MINWVDIDTNVDRSYFTFFSKGPSQFYDPCAEASKMSMKCLERNNYDKDMCTEYFKAYKECKQEWVSKEKNCLCFYLVDLYIGICVGCELDLLLTFCFRWMSVRKTEDQVLNGKNKNKKALCTICILVYTLNLILFNLIHIS